MNEVALIAHDLREPFQSRLSFDETIDAGRVLLHKLGEILCAAVRVCLFQEQSGLYRERHMPVFHQKAGDVTRQHTHVPLFLVCLLFVVSEPVVQFIRLDLLLDPEVVFRIAVEQRLDGRGQQPLLLPLLGPLTLLGIQVFGGNDPGDLPIAQRLQDAIRTCAISQRVED